MNSPILLGSRGVVRSGSAGARRPVALFGMIAALALLTGCGGGESSGPAASTSGGKFFRIGAEGIVYGDTAEIKGDRGYAVTPVLEARLAQLAQGALQKLDPHTATWFDPLSSEPLLWYHQTPEGYEFYGLPAFHPGTGDRLQPVSRDMRKVWEASVAAGPSALPVVETARANTAPYSSGGVGSMGQQAIQAAPPVAAVSGVPANVPVSTAPDARGYLSLETDPPGAQILGASSGRSYGRTPARVEVTPGRWNFALVLPGHERDIVTGSIRPGEEVTRRVSLRKESAEPATALSRVETSAPPFRNQDDPATMTRIDLTTPEELAQAAGDLSWLSTKLQEDLTNEPGSAEGQVRYAVKDAAALTEATRIFAADFGTHRTDPPRFQKLVHALAQFNALFDKRFAQLQVGRTTRSTWFHISKVIRGIVSRADQLAPQQYGAAR